LLDSFGKSNGKMFVGSTSFYAQWRSRGAVPALREDAESGPPERLLQAIWQHQRLLRDKLQTLDAQPLRVHHPGFKNREAGPDFRNAVVQFGSEPPREGDVEVDLCSSGWRAHRHETNPDYQGVILHVVWDANTAVKTPVATLVLRHVLDAPVAELNWWLGHEAGESPPQSVPGKCSALLRELPAEELAGLLRQAAYARLEAKAAQLQARARQAGWEQALWEGLFRALGYKQNVWPMQRLAELRPRWQTQQCSAEAIQARLFGIGGLLPSELTRSQSAADRHLRRIWDQWWRERDEFGDCVLPRSAWRFHGLRPANNPQRRLALAAHWLAADNLPTKLEKWIAVERTGHDVENSLLEILHADTDDFWLWHWTLRSRKLVKPQPLLGATRLTDLAVNVILPWLWMRSVEGNNETLRQRAEQRYFAWPAAEDNARLRLGRQRLLGGAHRNSLRGAAAQQGLIQILGDFCDCSNALCENCRFPELVRDWQLRQSAPRAEERQRALTDFQFRKRIVGKP
jgi:hypothetical protein